MKLPKVQPIYIDFETEAIRPRPHYPPRPVGLAIWDGPRPEYLAWGHPTRNNSTEAEAAKRLRAAWKSKRPLVFHNAKFDLDVAEEFFDLPLPDWHRIHCTMILGFLYNPNSKRLSLKEMAEDLLGIEPRERDKLRDWIRANIPGAKTKKSKWGEHIADAPGSVVAPYAKDDLRLPKRLLSFLLSDIERREMTGAYDRERALIPVLLDMERQGIPVDVAGIEAAVPGWERSLDVINAWLKKTLGAPDLDISSPLQLADAIENWYLSKHDELEWVMTAPTKTRPEGSRSTSIENLELALPGESAFISVLKYRSKLTNALQTFARPWLEMSKDTGSIYTIWNQVRQAKTATRSIGARTGRMSSTPNLQNVPKVPMHLTFVKADYLRLKDTDEGALLLPRMLRGKIEPLPNMRSFVTPDKGGRLVVSDYNQQELRILAHFDGGELVRLYEENPDLDFHETTRQEVNGRLGTNFPRKPIKNTNFGILYGMGIAKTAKAIGRPNDVAKTIRNAIRDVYPGLDDLLDELKERAVRRPGDEEPFIGKQIRTWGGRVYHVEPPMFSKKFNRVMEFGYKLLNTLIQSSAADCTKEVMIRYFYHPDRKGRMLLQVHDELVLSVPRRYVKREAKLLTSIMESIEFDVLMRADTEIKERWAEAA